MHPELVDLTDRIVAFMKRWGPPPSTQGYHSMVEQLRELLEEYGRNCIKHGDLADTEHPHKHFVSYSGTSLRLHMGSPTIKDTMCDDVTCWCHNDR